MPSPCVPPPPGPCANASEQNNARLSATAVNRNIFPPGERCDTCIFGDLCKVLMGREGENCKESVNAGVMSREESSVSGSMPLLEGGALLRSSTLGSFGADEKTARQQCGCRVRVGSS